MYSHCVQGALFYSRQFLSQNTQRYFAVYNSTAILSLQNALRLAGCRHFELHACGVTEKGHYSPTALIAFFTRLPTHLWWNYAKCRCNLTNNLEINIENESYMLLYILAPMFEEVYDGWDGFTNMVVCLFRFDHLGEDFAIDFFISYFRAYIYIYIYTAHATDRGTSKKTDFSLYYEIKTNIKHAGFDLCDRKLFSVSVHVNNYLRSKICRSSGWIWYYFTLII